MESVLRVEKSLWWEGFVKRVLSWEWKSERVMDEESGESSGEEVTR